jgi:hypothetical protein
MAAPVEVGIVGLRALLRDFQKMGGDASPLYPALKAAGRAAASPVAAATRSALPHQTGTLAGDVRVTASRTGATVRVGRKPIPYAGPVDFGGYPGEREFIAGGRYLFPAAGALAGTAAREYAAALTPALERFPWTNTTTNAEAVHD